MEAVAATSAVLERAKGVLMAEAAVSADTAYEMLLTNAEQRRRTLLEECWITLGRISPAPAPVARTSAAAADFARSDGAGPGVLGQLAQGLADVHGPDEVAELLLAALGGDGDLDAVMIYTVDTAGSLDLAGTAGVGDELARQWSRVPPPAGVAALEAVARRRAVWLEDPVQDAARYRLIGDPPERWPTRAWIPVPGAGPTRAVVGFFRTTRAPFAPRTRVLWRRAVRLCAAHLRAAGRRPVGEGLEEVKAVQRVLDGLSASVILLTPLCARGGEVEDYRIDAASPGAVDLAGRAGKELIGRRVLESYPTVAGTAVWDGYLDTLATGTVFQSEPLTYREVLAGAPGETTYSVRAARLDGRLVVSWTHLDGHERDVRKLADMQRLGNLGWANWDLKTDTVTWSDQVYAIFGRDPAEGPMTLEELPLHLVPNDRPALTASVQRLLGDGTAIDQPFRITTGDGARHLRIVAEARTDADGAPVEVHGFFQDLTAQRDVEFALRESERAVLVQRGMLRAERALAARLQNALLPIPEQSLEIAGLCIRVAYVPSDSGVNAGGLTIGGLNLSGLNAGGVNVGGDWYSAIELPDHSALFVVGDVAGHGLDAVATMAQLRFTAKGMAVTGSALPDVLARLNTLLLHTPPESGGTTATMIMARYQPWDRRLTWVRAGHPPPLLIRDGEARFLPLPEGALLGATFDAVYAYDILDLRPGDHLVLYTDGLVEQPGEDIGTGLDRLADAALRLVETGRAGTLARTLAAARPDHRDDVCVLDIRVPEVPTVNPDEEGPRGQRRLRPDLNGPARAG
ncbi:SpoIIE family protein phosphatase [Streptomyces sp. APSN-46.1]|nr:SpoIIE family protein phosphatase [Streptomyces sp. APSN-46.1]